MAFMSLMFGFEISYLGDFDSSTLWAAWEFKSDSRPSTFEKAEVDAVYLRGSYLSATLSDPELWSSLLGSSNFILLC